LNGFTRFLELWNQLFSDCWGSRLWLVDFALCSNFHVHFRNMRTGKSLVMPPMRRITKVITTVAGRIDTVAFIATALRLAGC